MLQAANLYANVTVAGAGQSVAALRGVSGAVDAAQARFSILGLKSQGMAKGLRQIAGGLVQVGEYAVAGLAAVTLASAREASGFQQQMELIHTQAGATQGEVASMTKAVQDMVHAVGTSPDELAKGLYHIESVGVRGAAALDVLKASAIGAKMGLADMESVSNALAAVSKSGSAIGGVKDMVTAMGTLNAIVGVGNMRMQDLVDAFGTGILGTSKAFGVGLRELGSALAVLTDAGVPAQVAATRLTTTFSHMAAPTAAALKVFKTLGISQFQFAADLRSPDGVFKAFEDLRAHLIAVGEWDAKMGRPTPQGTADVTKIFGGSRFGATAMQLLGQLDRVKLKYDQIGVSQSTFGEKVTATMATAGFHWGQFIADLKNDAISFGTGTLPALIRGLDRLDSFVVAHRADAVKLGVEVGDAIDKIGAAFDRIDWSRFQAGFEMVKGVADIAIQALKLVPPEAAVAFGALVGIDKLSGGLFGKGIGNIGGSILGQFLGRGSVTNPMWVRTAGGFGGGPGGVGGGISGKIGSALKIFGTVAIATASIYALAQQFQTFMHDVGVAQGGLDTAVAGTAGQTTQQSIDNLNNTIGNLQNMPVWDRIIANTYGGAQITKDLTDAAARLADTSGQTPSQLAQSRISVQAALDYAKANFGTAAMQPFIADLAKIDTALAALAPNASGGPDDRPTGTASDPIHTSTTDKQPGKALDDKVSAILEAARRSPAEIKRIIEADRTARGIKDTGPSTSLAPRLNFLAGGASGTKDVAVANAIALGFERGATPLFRDTKLIPGAIRALEMDARTLHGKDRAAIGADIDRLKAVQAAATRAAATKTAAASLAVQRELRLKKFEATVNISPTRVDIALNSRLVGAALIRYNKAYQDRMI